MQDSQVTRRRYSRQILSFYQSININDQYTANNQKIRSPLMAEATLHSLKLELYFTLFETWSSRRRIYLLPLATGSHFTGKAFRVSFTAPIESRPSVYA
jgi:hypothetical protein